MLGCYRYIELNPLRANMVAHPGEYRWSSYRVNAQGESNSMIQPHITYQALGVQRQQREQQYRSLFKSEVDAKLVDEIRQATNANYALGSQNFASKWNRYWVDGPAQEPLADLVPLRHVHLIPDTL